ncbi:MAG TPA: AAA family ATPase [Acidimicrobiales bacterium]|jgi:CO dehydrogenase maturation factor|nr:AAA family ATPase [Acidimicrobiales bacterium]
MRLGISGKGGVGKTTISAVLSRTLARRGHRVIAIDCDSDPNLGANIGLGEAGAARLRPFLDQSGPRRRVPTGLTPAQLLEQYGTPGPDGTTLLLGAMAEKAGSG